MSTRLPHPFPLPRSFVTAVVIAGLIGILDHRPATAAGADGAGTVDVDTISAVVRYDAPPPQTSACTWHPMRGVDPVTATNGDIGSHREMLYYKVCNNTIVEYRWITVRTTDGVRRSASDKVSRVVNMLLTRTAPPADKVVANARTWFWVPSAVWKPIKVTAWIETPIGPVSVTTTATPDRLRFTPGDGSATVDCDGPGRAWTRSLGDSARSSCMYVYPSASHARSGRSFRAHIAVKWSVKWTSNLGIGGPLPSITTGVPLSVRVHEVQALAR